MYIEKHQISTAIQCRGCKKKTKFIKGGPDKTTTHAKTKGWTQKTEIDRRSNRPHHPHNKPLLPKMHKRRQKRQRPNAQEQQQKEK